MNLTNLSINLCTTTKVYISDKTNNKDKSFEITFRYNDLFFEYNIEAELLDKYILKKFINSIRIEKNCKLNIDKNNSIIYKNDSNYIIFKSIQTKFRFKMNFDILSILERIYEEIDK